MAIRDLSEYRQQVVDACAALGRSGVLSASGHANFSVRVPGMDAMLLTNQASLKDPVRPESLALIALDGAILEGSIDPNSAEIIFMHAVVYQHRPEAGSVVHTHSPMATSFAVASQAMPVVYESQVRFGMTDGIPVAGYGPRGSQLAVDNIAAVLRAHQNAKAMLLENHGVLAFAENALGATRAAISIEETAIVALHARVLGGAKPIPPELFAMTQARAGEFERQGTLTVSQVARPEVR